MGGLSDGSVSDATGTYLLAIVTSGLSRGLPYIRIVGVSLLEHRRHVPKGCQLNAKITQSHVRISISGSRQAEVFRQLVIIENPSL